MKLFIILITIILFVFTGYSIFYFQRISKAEANDFEELKSEVIPESGFESKIDLKGSITRLVDEGVIDKAKITDLYVGDQEKIDIFNKIISSSEENKIVLTSDNSRVYLNVLWALGLANKMDINNKSPINSDKVNNFASTGGWSLGEAESGGQYFNKYEIVALSEAQEDLVYKLSTNIYRPCCGNHTFFQDCNHGSAMLGLMILGASQGLSEHELYNEALAFNSFWFPDDYMSTAFYFKQVKNISWQDVDAKIILSKQFSSSSGWRENIDGVLKSMGYRKKEGLGGSGC